MVDMKGFDRKALLQFVTWVAKNEGVSDKLFEDIRILLDEYLNLVLSKKSKCLCLKCGNRFTCDFALSAWAAQARLFNTLKFRPSFITYKCLKFKGDKK